MTTADKLQALRGPIGTVKGYWNERCMGELGFAFNLAREEGLFEAEVASVIESVYDKYVAQGAITKQIVLEMEEDLAFIKDMAKSYSVICVGHAHIDMNWMWGMPETVSVTMDTFRTVLNLMNEYPDFVFMQSQASTYEIIEEYAPEMLPEIKERIKEGRWEVTASQWVEADKNLPNGESAARHILYTKEYLSGLLDISPETLDIDFEPDTFGHNAQVPEALAQGGIKYYYHCRGDNSDIIYRWRSKSGSEVLTYREPEWYHGPVWYDMAINVPSYYKKLGVKVYLNAFGIGDHGGGPTRADLEKIIDMGKWPIYPTVRFGKMREFFEAIEPNKDKFPIVEGELNFIFTGCYTSQARVKEANRIGEDRLYDSEAVAAMSSMVGDAKNDYNERFAKAWKKILFNQFHDILPGSGVIDTREYSRGVFQEAMGYTMANANLALQNITSKIDTSSIVVDADKVDVAEGAGSGYGSSPQRMFIFPQTERGRGRKRIFHIYNTLPIERQEVVRLRVFDWKYDTSRAKFTYANGEEIPSRFVYFDTFYWGHEGYDFVIDVKVPPMGYTTVVLDEASVEGGFGWSPVDPRVDSTFNDAPLVLENEIIKAVFERKSMMLTSLTDKRTGQEVINTPSCYFNLIDEDTVWGMSSWRVGPTRSEKNINAENGVSIKSIDDFSIRKSITYEAAISARSNIRVEVILDAHSEALDFNAHVEWLEEGNSKRVPQLRFEAPLSYNVNKYVSDIALGKIEREEGAYDVPANSFMAATSNSESACVLFTQSKYGFRGYENKLSVNLIRSTTDPDRFPELGEHDIGIHLGVTTNCTRRMFEMVGKKVFPLGKVTNTSHKGELPLEQSFVELISSARLSSLKISEDKKGYILRVYSICDKEKEISLKFYKDIKSASLVDFTEKAVGDVSFNGNTVSLVLKAGEVKNIRVEF